MKKRLLSAFLALCMAVALLPVSAMAVSPKAQWGVAGADGVVNWTSSGDLADAVSAANSSPTGTMYIQLLSDISTAGLTFTTSTVITLDLNGFTLSSDGTNAICHSGSGTLTITDGTAEKNGKVITTASGSETIFLSEGSLIIEGGTIENAGTELGCAINNLFCSVEITGGTVYCAGVSGFTILNQYGTLNISGGVVRANAGTAIFINGIGNVTIGGSALITSADKRYDFGTIYLPAYNKGNATVLKITGGTVENTAQTNLQTATQYETTNVINNRCAYTVEISGGMINATGERGVGISASKQGSIVILGGMSVVKGRYMAMNAQLPTLSLDAQLRAGTNYESDALDDRYLTLLFTPDVPTSIFGQYKYLRFAPSTAVARIDNKFYTNLQEAFDAATNGSTVQLLCDSTLLQPLFTVYVFNRVPRDYTLDLNGKKLISKDRAVIESDSPLTIIDTSEGKAGVIEAGRYCKEAILNSSRLVIAGGTVISGETSEYTIRNLISGTVSIAGGTVISSGNRAHAINNTSYYGTINVSDGLVSASGTDSAAIYNASSGTVNVSGGMVSSALYYAAYTTSKSIAISLGSPILKGGKMATNIAPKFDYTELMVTASNHFDGSTPVSYDAANIAAYKYLEFVPAPIRNDDDQSSGIDSSTPATDTTTANNHLSNASATIWLSGSGLSNNDLLITEALTSGAVYNAMLKLAEKEDIFHVYDISLKSGITPTGSIMYLTFDLTDQYAGQAFTLVHKKADGTYEYLHATANADGKVKFGPVYELSPFMLVKGRLLYTPSFDVVNIPKTGDSSSPHTFVLLILAAACCTGTTVYRKKHTQA